MEQLSLEVEKQFDLGRVQTYFNKCLENDFDLQAYVNGYIELNKFFTNLGGVFYFIVRDVTEKTQILSQHLKASAKDNYKKIEAMLDYEQNNDLLLDPPKQPAHHLANGARTLLRLHRALLFVVKLVDGFKNSKENDRMAPAARTAYNTTLAQFHPLPIRIAVRGAVYLLPSRRQLIADLAGQLTIQEANHIMESTVATGQAVYDAIQKLYSDRGLLDLP